MASARLDSRRRPWLEGPSGRPSQQDRRDAAEEPAEQGLVKREAVDDRLDLVDRRSREQDLAR